MVYMAQSAISPTRSENYPEWYQEVVKAAELAESSPVRGCMVIKPWGYALWENMQSILDRMFKDSGHVNAYFPLLIPLSFLEKEAEHVEGFAKECAVVTHHRLRADDGGRLHPDPTSALEEPYVIRPTSETIIGHMYAKWIKSYRDLPVLMNQWCNVMRWEMRTRLFLRTAEFLWQEGHTVHATAEEAMDETLRMLDVYADFAENYMAMPVVKGLKTKDQRFPGAVSTYTIEALMQDRKALQAGTSHFLGQNFAKAAGIKFLNKMGVQEVAWTTSWGVSTRLIGGLIMTHSDDDGLVLPPRLAPTQVILLPIYRDESERASVLEAADRLVERIKAENYSGSPVRVKVDHRDLRGGDKFWQALKQGVPIRLELGPRDLAKGQVVMGRRDQGPKDKAFISFDEAAQSVSKVLSEMQQGLLSKAKSFREAHVKEVNTLEEFESFFGGDQGGENEKGGGFAAAHWSEAAIGHECLARLKVTPRCLPLDGPKESGRCLFTGEPSSQRVLFARSY